MPPTGRIGATTLIVLAALAVAIGFFAGSRLYSPPAAPALKAALLYPVPRALPAFKLAGADGRPFTLEDWRGRWSLAFFGFTHCPDVCPNTLAVFKQVWSALGNAGRTGRVRFDFISVDPERDTPDKLAAYVAWFNKDFGAATGSDEELTALTRALGLVYARVPDANGSYTIDHSAAVVIIDPQGRQVGLFRPPFVAETIVADLLALTEAD